MNYLKEQKDKLEDTVLDKLARHLGNKLTLDAHDAESRPQTKNSHGEFVGGFLGEHRTSSQKLDNGRYKPLPPPPTSGGASSPFAQPGQAYVARPGPLPVPPVIRMPEPHTGWYPEQSLTSQYAHSMWNEVQVPPPQATLGPPPPDLPYRPHSDPSDSAPTESISVGRPPRTPKRTKRPSLEPPSTVPTKISQSRSSSAATPSKPARKRASSASAAQSPSASIASNGTLRCVGLTQAGQRCKNKVKPSAVLLAAYDEGDSDDDGPAVYCSTHKDKVISRREFISPVTKDPVKYSEYIPKYLEMSTQLQLRQLMTDPASAHDTDGFIYGFEILDDKKAEYILLKVGRTITLNKRMDQWDNQCGSKSQHLRGCWPEVPGGAQPDAMGRLKEGRKGKFCHRLERLIHVELRDLVQNTQYLSSEFPDVEVTEGAGGKPPPREKCPDCGKRHQEIFEFKRAEKGTAFHKKEWDDLVKPLIYKWGKFVETHLVQAEKEKPKSEESD